MSDLIKVLQNRYKEKGNPVWMTFEEFGNVKPQVHDWIKEVLMFQASGQSVPGVQLKEKCNIVLSNGTSVGRLDSTVEQVKYRYLQFNLSPQHRIEE